MSLSLPHNDVDRQLAVVIGGSMAGLLAARVLSDHFKEVTILERDWLSEQIEPRKGVPQGRHVPLLLMQGELILRELFPDLYPVLAQEGAVPVTSSEMQWYDAGLWKGPSHLLKPPTTLFDPRIVWAVLCRELARRQSPTAAPAADEADARESNQRTPMQGVRYTQKELLS